MTTEWYYASDNRQMGPVAEAELDSLAAAGVIEPQTLVWRDGMESWRAYSSVRMGGALAESSIDMTGVVSLCSQCHNAELQSEMVRFGANWVCANCKDRYAQQVREGGLRSDRIYPGFGTRVGAHLIDSFILWVAQVVVQLGYISVAGMQSESLFAIAPQLILLQLVNISMGFGYYSWTTYHYGGSPGKLALGCRVVTADGAGLTFARSAARYAASLLSIFTLGIGYIMAAFDDERRTMHDRICDTRVVWKAGR